MSRQVRYRRNRLVLFGLLLLIAALCLVVFGPAIALTWLLVSSLPLAILAAGIYVVFFRIDATEKVRFFLVAAVIGAAFGAGALTGMIADPRIGFAGYRYALTVAVVLTFLVFVIVVILTPLLALLMHGLGAAFSGSRPKK